MTTPAAASIGLTIEVKSDSDLSSVRVASDSWATDIHALVSLPRILTAIVLQCDV